MNELKTEYVKVKDLKMYENNTRKHQVEDLESIRASIEEFGFCDPIGIWGKDNVIVEGHGRYMACLDLGIEEVPCIRLDHLTDEQRKAYAIAHNKTAEMSTWDYPKLSMELQTIDGIDMSEFGFDEFALLKEEANDFEANDEANEREYNYSITYELAFESEEQQSEWYGLLKQLKALLPDCETITDRVVVAVKEYCDGQR